LGDSAVDWPAFSACPALYRGVRMLLSMPHRLAGLHLAGIPKSTASSRSQGLVDPGEGVWTGAGEPDGRIYERESLSVHA
jgi:hypothetical protein